MTSRGKPAQETCVRMEGFQYFAARRAVLERAEMQGTCVSGRRPAGCDVGIRVELADVGGDRVCRTQGSCVGVVVTECRELAAAAEPLMVVAMLVSGILLPADLVVLMDIARERARRRRRRRWLVLRASRGKGEAWR